MNSVRERTVATRWRAARGLLDAERGEKLGVKVQRKSGVDVESTGIGSIYTTTRELMCLSASKGARRYL